MEVNLAEGVGACWNPDSALAKSCAWCRGGCLSWFLMRAPFGPAIVLSKIKELDSIAFQSQ